ncbi:hypothetical protein GCM10010279_43240 [Streptomyces mutabilis]|nr:hypothetical protein GCM10010279_43240 [Streptomyces mutabilis]
MRAVRRLHGGAGLRIGLRGHAAEGRCPRCGNGIGVLSVDGGFPRQVVDESRGGGAGGREGILTVCCPNDSLLSKVLRPVHRSEEET